MENQAQLVLDNLYKSREEGKPEMVALECQNGRVFAHKNILVAGSDYFNAMFSGSNIENQTNVVSLSSMRVEVLDIVVKFIYSQNIPTLAELQEGLVKEIIIAADRMVLRQLFGKYWDVYSTALTYENFLNVWLLADMFGLNEIVATVTKFILLNLKSISATHIIFDFTRRELDNMIANDVSGLKPVEIGEFIEFVLIWGSKNRIDDVIDLISKCNIKILPNSVLRDLLSRNQFVVNSKPIHDMLSREATTRWLNATSPHFVINVFETDTESGEIIHSVKYLNQNDRSIKRKGTGKANLFQAVSRTGKRFEFGCNALGYFALDTKGCRYLHPQLLPNTYERACEAINHNEIFFRRTSDSYRCFNFEEKTWRTIKFKDEIDISDSMLMATADGKFIFDVDERRMKIVDNKLATCRTVEKLPGLWKAVACRTLDTGKLIFFRESPTNNLIIYDVSQENFWLCPVSITFPEITNLFFYASYAEDTLLFTPAQASCDIYSLKTKSKIYEHVDFHSSTYFDLSVKVHSLGEE